MNCELNVDVVGVLFIVWGLLTTLVGVSTLALGLGAVALIASASHGGSQMAAGVAAALFTALAIIAMTWGAAHVAIGVPLRRHVAWARLGALTLGSVDLLLLPFGTALGLYTLWVLLSEGAKSLFQPSPGEA